MDALRLSTLLAPRIIRSRYTHTVKSKSLVGRISEAHPAAVLNGITPYISDFLYKGCHRAERVKTYPLELDFVLQIKASFINPIDPIRAKSRVK